MTEHEAKIIQEIISEDGDCLDYKRCGGCPFKGSCLPSFLDRPPSHEERLSKALNALAHYELLNDEDIV